MKILKKNRKFANILKEFARKKLKALIKKLLNFREEKPKWDFV